MKRKNKKIGNIMLGIVLVLSLINIIALPMQAGDYEPQADSTVMGALASSKQVEVGSSITLSIWINSDADDGCQGFKFNYFNWTAGIFEATEGTARDDDSRWWLFDGGTATNATGTFVNTQGGLMTPYTDGRNFTACNISFASQEIGTCYFTFNDTEVYDQVAGNLVFSTLNETVIVYPQSPASLGVSVYNMTGINLTFTPGTGGDNVTLCGKSGSYPSNPQDSVIYNGSLHAYNHSDLENCTTYKYRAWTWNDTAEMHSLYYREEYGTTDCPTNFTFSGITPAKGATTANCSYNIAVNLTITNSGGHSATWYINTTNGDAWSGTGVLNTTTPAQTMTGLDHDTLYYWNVTAISGSDKAYSNNSFTTGVGGGSAPTASNPTPSNGATSVSINPATFSVDIADTEGDPVGNVSFYWNNGTRIGKDTTVAVPGTASVSGPAYTLDYATTYRWYAQIDDGCSNATSATYSFTTDTRAITITKEWVAHAGNSTIQAWINITNSGQADLVNVVVNDSMDTHVEYNTSVPVANWTGAGWISFLEPTFKSAETQSIMIWFNVTDFRLANNTAINNAANVTEGNVTFTATAPSALRYRYELYKTANISTFMWNTTAVNYTINVTNTGDFTLHNVTINESIPANLTFVACHGGTANATNTSFNISDVTPGSTVTLYIEFNTSYKSAGKALVNGTQIYNNVTAITNETEEILETHYLFVGATTELIRIRYDSHLTDVQNIGNSVLNILGVLLIIGSIMLIVYVVNRYNLFGGGE